MLDPIEIKQYGDWEIRIYYDENPESPREWDNIGTMVAAVPRHMFGDEQVDDLEEWEMDLALECEPSLEETLEWWNGPGYEKLQATMMNKLVKRLGDSILVVKSDIERIEAQAFRLAEEKKRNAITRAIDKHVAVMLPLRFTDYGGGQCLIHMNSHRPNGWIYVTKERLRKECGWNRISQARLAKVEEWLEGEVETYNDYLAGQVFGFVVVKKETCPTCGHTEEMVVDGCAGFYDLAEAMKEAECYIPTHIKVMHDL